MLAPILKFTWLMLLPGTCWKAPTTTRAHGRLQFFIGHLAVAVVAEFEEGLDPDLFKNVNPEALIAGICFVVRGLDLLKVHSL